ncbi:MAG: tRNA lysidine(34) synthetase TilS [Kineosporiaceae bacterium]|nr:tRNA lysidine(34) synthetase TilS [Aeromicrobium sp.]
MGRLLDPTVATARNRVRDNLVDLPPGSRLVLAVSGGADSLALAAVTGFAAAKLGHLLNAVIVDHQLQAASAAVATEALKDLEKLGIEARVITVSVGTEGGMEAAARRARYAVFDALEDVDAVLLGHTLDDQAETVLLGLGRGSGSRSIAGMAPVDGRYRRPFLGMTRKQTETICRASGLGWWTDPHNSDPAYRRVRLRLEVLPLLEDVLGGGVAQALARTADFLRNDNAFLDAAAATYADCLSAASLAELAPAIRGRVLRTAALGAGADPSELAAHHIRGIDELVTRWHGQERIELPGGVAAVRVGDALTFRPTPVTP